MLKHAGYGDKDSEHEMKVVAIVMMIGAWSAGPPDVRYHARHDGPPEGGRYVQDVQAFRPAVSGRLKGLHYISQAAAAAPSGDAKRGKTLFDQTYRCYACHGFAGETGSPRLVPMSRTEESFTDFVRKPSRPAMPAFSDVPAKDLADVYAYLRSLRSTAPAAASIPLLNDILTQIR
jgi:mono/diheme cytochrome c family protein